MENLELKVDAPNYKDLYEGIKKQITDRSGLLMRRVVLIMWPALIYAFFIAVLAKFNVPANTSDLIVGILIILAPFALLWVFAMTHIFSIEKVLWVDACGDQKKLKAEESLKIARSLFWVTFRMRIYLFFRYYFFPLAIYLAALFYIIYLVIQKVYLLNIWQFIFLFIVIAPIILWLYYFYIKIKLRYAWFIFLDKYSKELSFGDVFEEMNKLNEVNKSDAFRKSLIVTLGSDILQNATQVTFGSIFSGIGKFGKGADVFGNVASVYSNELTSQTSSLVKLAANYILYQYSRNQLYTKSQEVNENIYTIIS